MYYWDRPTLKALAKDELRISYWLSLAVCLVGGFLSNTPARDRTLAQHGGHRIMLTSFSSILTAFLPFAFLAATVGIVYFIFISGPVDVGMSRYFIQSPKGERSLSNLFWVFRSGYYTNVVITMLVYRLIIIVGFILFVVPGIILHYHFRMVPYILADDPGTPTSEALRMSGEMTRDEKLNIFVLDLSFIGWYILGGLFFGIGVIFVMPYVNATFAQLYGALYHKTTGTDPYAPYRGGFGGYPPDEGYNWGDETGGRAGQDYYTPGTGYAPPPPPPYGRHTKGPDEWK